VVEDVVPLRNALVKRLEGNAAMTAALGEGSVWGEKQPADAPWPFLRYGAPILTTDELSGGLKGGRHRVTIHTFARGPSMDQCAALMKITEAELDGQDVALDFPPEATRSATAYELFLNGAQIIPDGPDDWHGIQEFDVAVAGA